MKYIIQQINTPSALTLSVAQGFEVAKKLQRLSSSAVSGLREINGKKELTVRW